MAERQKSDWGARLKRLAKSAGFTAESLAERLGCSPSAVWAWWSGRNEPSVDMLRAYAEAVKVSVDYLVGQEGPMGPAGSLQEWRLRFADLLRQGVSPDEAIDRITGPSYLDAESLVLPDSEMTAEERAILKGSAEAMREVLEHHSGGRWEELTVDQRAAVLQLIEVMVQGNRGEAGGEDAGG